MKTFNTDLQAASHHWIVRGAIAGLLAPLFLPLAVNASSVSASEASKTLKSYSVAEASSSSAARRQHLHYQPSKKSSQLGDFSGTGAPRSRGSAGSRGECLKPSQGDRQSLASPTALVPLAQGQVNGETLDIPFGLTTRSHPTLWFQFPEHRDAIRSLSLTLIDESTQELVQEVSDISKQDSAHLDVWSVQWPTAETGLALDRTYRWFLVIQCENPASSGILLSGLIRREAPPAGIAESLLQSSHRDRAFDYANSGIWYEAVLELHLALDENPNAAHLYQDWNDLMDSIQAND